MTDASAETRSVIIEREFPHPPEKLWRALTQPHLMQEWLMRTDFAPEVGRRFHLTGDWGGALDTNSELERHGMDVEGLLANPAVRKFVNWVEKRGPDFTATATKKQR